MEEAHCVINWSWVTWQAGRHLPSPILSSPLLSYPVLLKHHKSWWDTWSPSCLYILISSPDENSWVLLFSLNFLTSSFQSAGNKWDISRNQTFQSHCLRIQNSSYFHIHWWWTHFLIIGHSYFSSHPGLFAFLPFLKSRTNGWLWKLGGIVEYQDYKSSLCGMYNVYWSRSFFIQG